MSGKRKEQLLAWVDEQTALDPVSKFVLMKLALYADAECVAWAAVTTLAGGVNVSVRTIQYRLRSLEAEGYLAATGETHRTDSGRDVPLYRLAPEVEGLGLRKRMGAKSAPIAGKSPRAGEPMGADSAPIEKPTGADACTPRVQLRAPRKEPIGTYEQADACSTRARRPEADPVRQAVGQWPAGATSEPAVRRLWPGAAAEAGGDGVLLACIAAFLADPVLKRRDYGPPSLQRWLSEKRWIGYLAAAGAAGEGSAGRAAFADARLRAAVVAETGESWTASWLDPCRLEGRTILPPRQLTADTLRRQIGPLLRARGFTLGAVGAPATLHQDA